MNFTENTSLVASPLPEYRAPAYEITTQTFETSLLADFSDKLMNSESLVLVMA